MQRDYRYTLGEQLKRVGTDMIVLIYRANKNVEKSIHIALAREKLVEIQLLVRILNETRQLSDKQFALLAERTTGISKQLASWERSANGRGQS